MVFYAGRTELTDSQIEGIVREGGIVVLEETRAMRTLMIPTPQGVNQSNMLTPISICRGGVRLRIRPISWFWPDEEEEAMEVLLNQLERCDHAEVKHRAAKAGIHLAGTGAVTPDGMKSIS